jgi:hypothetical protein
MASMLWCAVSLTHRVRDAISLEGLFWCVGCVQLEWLLNAVAVMLFVLHCTAVGSVVRSASCLALL